MAIHVEDHPLSYRSFEGTIAPKQYGAGTVIVWDTGIWEPVGDAQQGLKAGKLFFSLDGHKMRGLWELVRIAKPGDRQEPWILFKKKDRFARPAADYDVITALPDSVIAKPLKAAVSDQPGKGRQSATVQRAKRKQAASNAVPRGAVRAPLPDKLAAQLATLAADVPSTGEWLYEIKFDGYRLLTRIVDGKPTLITRGGHDWSDRMPALMAAVRSLGIRSGWLDGEIVVLAEDGRPSFNALQNAFDGGGRPAGIVYFLFDLPYLEGYDLRAASVRDRRQVLEAMLRDHQGRLLRFSAAFEGDGRSILTSACRSGLEGVIAKRADAPYRSRRTETWLKLKCKHRQEFVVCGYTDRSDGAAQIGSLFLGVHDAQGRLMSVGSVGTGWGAADAAALKTRLARIGRETAPYDVAPPKPGRWSRRRAGDERWVEPRLVAEIEFAEWTPDNRIRHAVFISLRSDKPARKVVREIPEAVAATSLGSVVEKGRSIKVTHGERVIDPASGITKLELVRYYESIAEWILPHLKGRPCSLVRGPNGVPGQLFFQKHGERIGIPGIRDFDPKLWPGHGALLEVATSEALIGSAQMNVIEFHTWNSKAKKIDKPDRMIFDLDPGEGTKWKHVLEAAALLRAFLSELALDSWLKTSGGKGLHVVVPIVPRLDYAAVKKFSKQVVEHVATVIPSRFVARSGPSNRIGKLFIDYLRNGHGATTAAALSARARPGLGVSMPVSWDELGELKSGSQWSVKTARDHLSFQKTDPWVDYWTRKQTLTAAIKRLN